MNELRRWFEDLTHYLSAASIRIGKSTITAESLLELVLILFVCWWAARLLERGIIRVLAHRVTTPGATSAGYTVGRLARYGTLIVGTFLGLQLVGWDLSNLALVGGALGIGIGFGLQSVVGNFVSGIILLLERSLKVGDFVDLASGVRGTVTEISVRYTRVTTNANVDVIVPNSEFTNSRVTNWTLDNYYRRVNVPFSVAYGSDKQEVREAALAAARAVSHTVEDDARHTDVWFTKFGDSALEFELVVWIGPGAISRPGSTLSAYLWALDDALRLRKIEVPFPQRDLHLRSGNFSPPPTSTAERVTRTAD